MIVNVVISLLILGALSLWKIRQRYNNIFVSGSFLFVAGLLIYFIQSWQTGMESSFFMLWDSSASGDIKIAINSTLQNYHIVFPFFMIAVVALFNNLVFRYEKKKKAFSTLVIFILTSFIMLISGDNFVQIITCVFVIDILSQMLIQDVHASRRYGIYNLVADMGLFLVFALMRGSLNNLNMDTLTQYYDTVKYKDLIAAIMLVSLAIKFGFFVFHSYLLDLKSAKFHRLVLIPYLSTPMVALILFIKMRMFLAESHTFYLVFNILLGMTILWGAAGAAVIRGLKEKSVYFSMMIVALLVKLSEENGFVWNLSFSWLLICGFLFNICIYYLHYYANRENNLALLFRRQRKISLALYAVCVVAIFLMMAFSVCLAGFYSADTALWIYGFALLFLPTAANMFSQTIKNVEQNTDVLSAQTVDRRPLPMLLLIVSLSAAAVCLNDASWYPAIAAGGLFVVLMWIRPQRWLIKDSLCEKMQNADFFSGGYNIIIARPIKFIGRVLTLLVDFVFFERTLVSTVMLSAGIVVRGFRQINREGVLRSVLFVLAAFLILAIYFLRSRV